MSFEHQQSGWSCGLAALRYAYSLLGGGLRSNEVVSEDLIRRKAGKTRWRVFREGTSEFEIVRAAKKLGLSCKLHPFVKRDPGRVLTAMRRVTSQGHAVLACVHSDDELFYHWIVIAGFSGRWAIVLDPAVVDAGMPERTYWLADPSGTYVPGLLKTTRLQEWLDPGEELTADAAEDFGEQHLFLEVSVAPGHQRGFVPGMLSEELVRRMRRDIELAVRFDELLDDLKLMFRASPTRSSSHWEAAHRFLRRHRARLVALTRAWVMPNACDTATIHRELQRLEAICRCYQLTVKPGQEEHTMASVAFWLGWTSATCAYEVDRFAA